MKQINKLNNLILEQIIRVKIQQLLQEQEGPDEELADDDVEIEPITVKKEPEKVKKDSEKVKKNSNMELARQFGKKYKASTGNTVNFAHPVKVDNIIPTYTENSFEANGITYKHDGTWENATQTGDYSVDKFTVVTMKGTNKNDKKSADQTKKKRRQDTKHMVNDQVNTTMRNSLKKYGKVDAWLIANIIKGSTRWYNDKESRANIAFLSIKDAKHYYEVKKHLKDSPWLFIQKFMNTSKVFKDSDFSNPSYFNNNLAKSGAPPDGWISCDTHLKGLNVTRKPGELSPDKHTWNVKNPLGGTSHDLIQNYIDPEQERFGEKTNTFIQYVIGALVIKSSMPALRGLKFLLKILFPGSYKRLFANANCGIKSDLQIMFSRKFRETFPGYNKSMVSYDKLSRWSPIFFNRQLAIVKNSCRTQIEAGAMTRDEAKQLVDIFEDNKILIMQHLKNKLIKKLFNDHLRLYSFDKNGVMKTLWTNSDRAGIMRANDDFLQIVPPDQQAVFRRSLESWVNRHTAPTGTQTSGRQNRRSTINRRR